MPQTIPVLTERKRAAILCLTNEQIAEKLFISLRTKLTYVNNG